MLEIFRSYNFPAAHSLPNVPDGHKCKRVHGHNFVVVVKVRGGLNEHLGWVMDFARIDQAMEPLVAALDHQYLNDFMSNPTSECIAMHFARHLQDDLPGVLSVEVQEEPECGAIFTLP